MTKHIKLKIQGTLSRLGTCAVRRIHQSKCHQLDTNATNTHTWHCMHDHATYKHPKMQRKRAVYTPLLNVYTSMGRPVEGSIRP